MRHVHALQHAFSADEVLRTIPDALFALDSAWRFTYINAQAEQLLERHESQLLGRVVWEEFPPAVGSLFDEQYRRALETGRPVSFTAYYRPLARWFSVHAAPLSDGLLVHFHDVNALKVAEERASNLGRLQAALRRVATAVAAEGDIDNLFDLICDETTDLLGAVACSVLRFTRDGTGYEVLKVRGDPRLTAGPPGIIHPVSARGCLARIQRGAELTSPVGDADRVGAAPDATLAQIAVGGCAWGAVHAAWPEDSACAAEQREWLLDLADLLSVGVANAAARAEVEHRAATDPLTGLANLTTLLSRLDGEIARCRRHGGTLTLALIDVDHFKAINDRGGHLAGDRVLCELAAGIVRSCRAVDLAARVGGDEFAIVLSGTGEADALRVLERLRADVSDTSRVTVSAGLCAWEPGMDAETLRQRADDALYWAKQDGRDSVHAYDPALKAPAPPLPRSGPLPRAHHAFDEDISARAAHEYLMSITASIADGLLVADADGDVAYANAAAGELLGAPVQELVGRPAAELIGPAATAPSGEHEEDMVHRSDADVFTRADGRPLPVAWTSAPMMGSSLADGRVVVFRDDSERRQRETRLEREAEALHWGDRIRGALQDDRLLLYAQPILSVADGEIDGHELLIRMQDPDGTLVSPGEFLPAAERHDLMGHIDCWVISRAAELAQRGDRVHVNISTQSIESPEVLRALRAAAAFPATAPRMTIEITETALGHDAAAVARFAAHVHDLGFRVALDDFGTGYNTLSRVKQLPIDELKIDIQFVRDLRHDAASAGVVKAIISLAQALGSDTVAEGVEDAETAALLRELGVTHLQGYHFGRPAPVSG